MMLFLAPLLGPLQTDAAFLTEAPLGTGLEWMTVAAVVLPALVLIALVYAVREETV
jgi:hypothetical protein